VKGLGSYADTLSSGGLVLGPSLAAGAVSLDQARSTLVRVRVWVRVTVRGLG
jgi:hypothetical protein